jgi:hypothetical protein
VRFGDLSFFAACGGLGDRSCFGATCGFDAFSCGGACSLFRFAQSTSHGGVGIVSLMGASGLRCMARGGLCSSSGGFGFGLSQ